jgi:peptide/nickel transport system substrate-binding protein
MSLRKLTAGAALMGLALATLPRAPLAAMRAGAESRPLRLGLVQQPNSLDPQRAVQFYENYLAEGIFSALTVIDDHGNVAPDLAETVPTRRNGGISADGKSITYHLRAGVRWQDGAPLTSHDVAFTFARMHDPKVAFPEASVFSIVERLDTPDPRTVILRLRTPWADATSELFVGGQDGSIVPAHLLEGASDAVAARFGAQPVGSGPYSVERWERGNRIVLRANSAYFRGKPGIDRIDVEFVPDQNTLALRVRTGELDFSPQLPQAAAAALHDSASLRVRTVSTYADLELVFQTRRAPVDDARTRRALLLAIDRARLTQAVYHGFAQPADDLVPPQSPYHVTDPHFQPHGDPAAARRLLDAAGWKAGPSGVRTKGGTPLAFALTVPAGYPASIGSAIQIQAMWKAVGADVALRPMLSNVLLAPAGSLASGDFDVYIGPTGYATSPDRSDMVTTSGLPPSGRNYSRYSNGDVDRWTAEARAASDERVRRSLYAKISERIRADCPRVPLLWQQQIYVYNTALTGLRPETVNSDLWNVYEWRLDG